MLILNAALYQSAGAADGVYKEMDWPMPAVTMAAIGLARARPFDASLVDHELPTKSKILKNEAPGAGEKQLEQSNERGNQLNHCYQNVRTAGLAVK